MPAASHPSTHRALSLGAWSAIAAAIGLTLPLAINFAKEQRQPRYPVTGAVRLDGRPAAGATLEFYRAGGDWFRAPVATAAVGSCGELQWKQPGPAFGLPVGDYVVALSWKAHVVRGEDYVPGPNVLPARFAHPQTTPLVVTIHQAPNHLGLLKLESARTSFVWRPEPRWINVSIAQSKLGVMQ